MKPEDTLSGFQDFFLKAIIREKSYYHNSRIYSIWPPECRRPPECRFLGKMVSDASYQTIHGKMVPNFQF